MGNFFFHNFLFIPNQTTKIKVPMKRNLELRHLHETNGTIYQEHWPVYIPFVTIKSDNKKIWNLDYSFGKNFFLVIPDRATEV